MEDQRGREAYFRFTRKKRPKQYRLAVACEYIARALANRLGLPAAKVRTAVLKGKRGKNVYGIVSWKMPAREVVTWRMAGENVHANPEKYVNQFELLRQVVVFDTWIANADRAAGNLILYRNAPTDKYSWYLIDHEKAFYGALGLRTHGRNRHLPKQTHFRCKVPKGLAVHLKAEHFAPMIQKIRNLPVSAIDMAMRSVPRGCLKQREKRILRRFLLHRRNILVDLMSTKNFCGIV
ncbi:hypothetical protein G3578_05705 [Brevibacillus sp. SYP-B805]|uniref:HipA family kinase n=1 Tax=Brevibacillus sp. SYP-B805 TaxID=1578199 RepID=UPI0013ED718F|nr:HipA family kinase [Brevibacillus sp. SYP-B805]NGQ94676.1 hypothetical protein [Brevibacillus sp. SYP-B805]